MDTTIIASNLARKTLLPNKDAADKIVARILADEAEYAGSPDGTEYRVEVHPNGTAEIAVYDNGEYVFAL